VGLSTQAQVSYPDNIFASTNQAQLHELVLKATQENGQENTVSGFIVDLTNVVSTPTNSELAIANPQTCAAGWHLEERNTCQPDDPSNPALGFAALPPNPSLGSLVLPPCDGSFQDCIYNGHLCRAGSTEHECELPDKGPEQVLTCQEEDDFCEPRCEP
jgi:hypothetical protein